MSINNEWLKVVYNFNFYFCLKHNETPKTSENIGQEIEFSSDKHKCVHTEIKNEVAEKVIIRPIVGCVRLIYCLEILGAFLA